MKTNIGGILLTEVNRMREIMGVNLITETIDPVGLVKKLLGVSDEVATGIAKEAGDDVSKYSKKLASIVGGTGSISDITTYLSKQGIGTSDDEIVAWIKTQPEIIDQIAKSSDIIMKKASKIVYGNLKLANFLTQNALDKINITLSIDLNRRSADYIIKSVDDCLDVLTKMPQRGNNADLDSLIKQLEDKKRLTENYKISMDSPTKVVDNVVGKSIISGDEVISNIKSLFKDEPEIIESISKVSKEEIDNVTSMVSKKSDSEIDNAFEKIKSVCGLNEAAKKRSLYDRFCSGSAKYTEAAYKGNVRMFKIATIVAAIVIGFIVVNKVFSKEGITIPKANVKFGEETYENTPSDFSKWVTKNGYSDADIDENGNYTYYVDGTRQEAIYDNNTKTFK
jgi:hypothetical protein